MNGALPPPGGYPPELAGIAERVARETTVTPDYARKLVEVTYSRRVPLDQVERVVVRTVEAAAQLGSWPTLTSVRAVAEATQGGRVNPEDLTVFDRTVTGLALVHIVQVVKERFVELVSEVAAAMAEIVSQFRVVMAPIVEGLNAQFRDLAQRINPDHDEETEL